LFPRLDLKKQGYLTYDEFQRYAQLQSPEADEFSLKFQFEIMNSCGNGKVTQEGSVFINRRLLI